MKKEKTKPNPALSDTEQAYDKLERDGVMFFNYCHMQSGAATLKNEFGAAIFVNERIVNTSAEEKYAILHEYAHLETGSLHRVNACAYQIECDEWIADRYVAHGWVPIDELKWILSQDGMGEEEIGEYFNFPARFIVRAINIYREEGFI